MNVKVKVICTEDAKLPQYAPEIIAGGNSGADLFSAGDYTIPSMGCALIATGLYVEVPVGVDMQIRSKSGIALKNNVFVLNSPGTVDPSYRGEVKVIMYNLGESVYQIKKGDKIAQAVFLPCLYAEFEEVENLSETVRGEGGFGHTGIRE